MALFSAGLRAEAPEAGGADKAVNAPPTQSANIDLALIPLECQHCVGVYAMYLMPPINPVGLEADRRLQDATVVLSSITPTDAGEHGLLQWDWSSQNSCTGYESGNMLFASDEVLERHGGSSRATSTCFFPYLRYDKSIVLSPSGLDAQSGLSPEELQDFFATKTFHYRTRAAGEHRVCPFSDQFPSRPEKAMPVGRVKVFESAELDGISRVLLNDHVVFSNPETEQVVRIYGLGSTYHGPMRVQNLSGFWHRLDSGKVLLTLPGDDPAHPRLHRVTISLHNGSPSFELDGARYIGQPEGGC